MYDQLAYLGLALAAVGVVLFLAWFGNYTAAMYAKLFGHIPKPTEQPQTRREYERVIYREEPNYFSHCTVIGSVMCSTVGMVRPGGITRING